MNALFAALLAGLLVYLLYDTWSQTTPAILRTGRLCDYTVAGAVFEDVRSAIQRGARLLEVHIYSDERDQPVVATSPQTGGSNVAVDNVSFESVCIDIANEDIAQDATARLAAAGCRRDAARRLEIRHLCVRGGRARAF
jgi:hypothetical protein